MAETKGMKYITDNRKARHDYFIHDTYEAGLALTGTEVKSLRAGRVNLKDSFCRIDDGEAYIVGLANCCYINTKLSNLSVRPRKRGIHLFPLICISKKDGSR